MSDTHADVLTQDGVPGPDEPVALIPAATPSPEDLARTPGVLRHLRRLTQTFAHDGAQVAYVHIYARRPGQQHGEGLHDLAPPLHAFLAQDSGVEGIACVDDVARAVVLALQVYQLTGSMTARALACDWLRFVRYMQRPDDHRLLNFILDQDGARNEDSQTSYPGGEPWTVRALHAYATAWRVLGDEDALRRFWRTILPATGQLAYTARYALAVMDLYETRPDRGLRRWIEDMCAQIIGSGPGYLRAACGQDEVPLYDYQQLHAVARAALLLPDHRDAYLAACETTVDRLVEPVIRDGFYHVFPTDRDHQSVFDVSSIGQGLEALYLVTGQARYRDLALACCAWLDGNNPAGAPVYDPQTGRCHDNINIEGEIAPTTGAESAIEAGFLQLVRCRLEGTRAGLESDPADLKQE